MPNLSYPIVSIGWWSRFVLLLTLVRSLSLAAGSVVINEIMHHPASGNLGESFVELWNHGATATNLSGFQLAKGLSFTFPTNTILAPGAYLVVAADQAAFATRHPEVPQLLAGWTPPLGSHLQLLSTNGQVVSEVHFATEGDWAIRQLTTNGFASYGHFGWEWLAPHDGQGASLELRNPDLPESAPLNWQSSLVLQGTPGQRNSQASTNIPPLVREVSHSPVVPQPNDTVTVQARVQDERANGLQVTLYFRDASSASPGGFTAMAMLDDGQHGDGVPGDGIFAGQLPPRPAGTVVEFYLEARDLEAHLRTYPAVETPAASARTANMLYQVEEAAAPSAQPFYRIIMTEMERAELHQLARGCPGSAPGASMDSDAQMNATWISMDGVQSGGTSTTVRYNVGVRNRGHGTRSSNPNNYHVNIPADRMWKGLAGLNLNSQYAPSQVLGSALFRRVGLPMPAARSVQLRVNSTNLMNVAEANSFGSYSAHEQYNGDFIARAFPLDPRGHSYRAIRQAALCDSLYNNNIADLTWQGPNFGVAAYTNTYFRQNQFLTNDGSDLIDLIAVLNSTNGYAPSHYGTDVRRRLDVGQWMKYMAVNTLLDNDETCLANGVGDDFALYRGQLDTRFQVLPYDLDSVLGRGLTQFPPRHNLFRMTTLPVMDRFMKEPEFAPIYYGWLRTLATTTFAPAAMSAVIDEVLQGQVPAATLANFKAFQAAQAGWVLSQIPSSLTISNALPEQSGYPRSTVPNVSLSGTADAVRTRSVRVNNQPASWVAWQGSWSLENLSLNPGIHRLLVQAFDAEGLEIERAYQDVWYDRGATTSVGGTVAADTVWKAAAGPYTITSTLTVPTGVTLTLEAGTTLYLAAGVNVVVANGGRIVAAGTEDQPIRWTVAPGSGVSWGGLTVNGAGNSPETQLTHVFFEGNGSTCVELAGGALAMDHVAFLTTTHQYASLDGGSFLISDCSFPTTSAAFELVHGTGGIRAGGRGIIRRCFFGTSSGYNDIIDFTGGNRDLGQPIVQFYDNVFAGGTDDLLDLDGTDAWIEGNIFLHVHRNGAPDSSSAVSGGSTDFGASGGGVRTSEITVIGNLFFDCDNAATAKQGNFFAFLNNTILHMTKEGGVDFDSGAINMRDTTPDITTFGAGCYLEGNIISDASQLIRNYDAAQTTVTLNRNVLSLPWAGPGVGNTIGDPLFVHVPGLAETQFTNWASAQVLRRWLALRPGSPAHGFGPHGRDAGGVIPMGAGIAGEPLSPTRSTSATLTVGPLRSGFGMPAAGWPAGCGYSHYRWRLDGGPWSALVPTATPIALTALSAGSHQVEVVGRRDSGLDQDDPGLDEDALVTVSRAWTVDPAAPPPPAVAVQLSEVLALNTRSLTNAGATPDWIELFNPGPAAIDLSGCGVTDDATQPYRYTFPAGTPLLGPGQYLVLFADSANAGPGIHLGFSLKQSGDAVLLYDRASAGGALIDQINFGVQARDISLSRAADGTWVAGRPTPGAPNEALSQGDPAHLRLNEWLADALFQGNGDFIELYNPDPWPVALGGLYLSNAEGAPELSRIPSLSFIGAQGYVAFNADGQPAGGADHTSFKLDAEVGSIWLSNQQLEPIDVVNYGPQTTDVALGRSPDGANNLVRFAAATPGGPNPGPVGGTTIVTNVSIQSVALLDITNVWRFDNTGVDRGTAWLQPSFVDSAWPSGAGLFGYETTPSIYPYPFKTTVPAPDQAGGHLTVYYRAHFYWDGSLAQYALVATNYVDDGAVYYLNGVRIGALRMPASVTYTTAATSQPNEGAPEILTFTNRLALGDNVMAVEVHQVNGTSSDDVFGMQLNAVQTTTNYITVTTYSMPVVLNEVLADNQSWTNAAGVLCDWIELYNPSTNTVDLADLSLSNDPNQPRRFVLPAGSAVGPGAFYHLDCDPARPVSATNTGFGLRATGESIYLFHGLAHGGGLIDALSFGCQTPDYAVGRWPDGTGTWNLTIPSAGLPNTPAPLGVASSLVLNEWMAAPSAGPDWFEIHNTGSRPVALGGLACTDDLTKKSLSPIPPLSFIGSGPHAFLKCVADNNPGAGADHVKFKLSAGGSALGLFAGDVQVDAIGFGMQAAGVAQGRFPDGAPTWASFPTTATPGEGNYLPLADLVVNEILTHTDPPLEDAVEFYNSGGESIDVGGWYLSDAAGELRRCRVPDHTVVPSHGYLVLYENLFNPLGSATAFTFNSAHGGRLFLSQADAAGTLTGYRAAAEFGAAANGVSFVRYPNSVGQVSYVAAAARTFGMDHPVDLAAFRSGTGAANAQPSVGPVVIDEVLFFPPLLGGIEDDTLGEFVELHNITSEAVPLFDPLVPTNTWQIHGGIDFELPSGISLPPGGRLLLVNFDPARDSLAWTAFRTRYDLPAGFPIYGPYRGKLANDGEHLTLYRPDAPQQPPHPDAGYVPQILVDRVDYLDAAPWPTGAGGTGASLQRSGGTLFGNDPGNWFVGPPSPGRANRVDPVDANADGLPDAWQVLYFGSAEAPSASPLADPDGDGLNNAQEHAAGTRPNDEASLLRLDAVARNVNTTQLQFQALAGHGYSVLASADPASATWERVADVTAPDSDGPITVTDSAAGATAVRFYRLVTPRWP